MAPFTAEGRQKKIFKKIQKNFASLKKVTTFAVPFETERDFLRPKAKKKSSLTILRE
jgi:hypothetical protein